MSDETIDGPFREQEFNDLIRAGREGLGHCRACGIILDDAELIEHRRACQATPPAAPEWTPPPVRRQPSEVRSAPEATRPLYRRVARRLRALADRSFVRCETCPAFDPSVRVAHADSPANLVLAEGELGPTLIPAREAVHWPGKVWGPLRDVGWCRTHETGVLPAFSCDRWRP